MSYSLQDYPGNIKVKARAVDNARFMSCVYRWMCLGLLVTGAVALQVTTNPDLLRMIFGNKLVFFGLFIVQLIAVGTLSRAIHRFSVMSARLIYLAYSALSGMTLAIIFLAYTHSSIVCAFTATAASFAGLSIIAYTTERDLGPIGVFCSMGLFGLIAVLLLSFFFPSLMSGTTQTIISVFGVLIFAGLTAYDTQKIKLIGFAMAGDSDSNEAKKEAVRGALVLYLDFINLFLQILRLMGQRK